MSTELCFDDAGNKLYANWWGGIRLGELGVYGEATGQPLTPEKPMKTVVCVGDSVTEGVWDDSGRLYGDKRSYPQQLAELLNVSQNTYSQYESGVIELTAEHLIKLADFYHVSVDYLLGRTDKPEMNQ